MIPLEAQPVLDVLRRDVPRPCVMPWGTPLRWAFSECPMGLHPGSTAEAPCNKNSFANGLCSIKAVGAFADWWDTQIDAQAAVDAIWPPQTV